MVHRETFKAPSRFNSNRTRLSLLIKLLLRCVAASFNRKMRLVRATTLYSTLLTSLIANATATSITLSQFQQISGFSETCTAAYNTPLTQCTESDFENGRSCSMNCVEALEKVSACLTTACRGIKAYPDTLIGLFFGGGGVEALCPNVHDSGGSTGSTGGITGGNSGGDNGGNSGGNNGGNSGGNGGGAQNSQTTSAVMTSKAPQEPNAASTEAQASTTQQTTQTQPAAASSPTSLLKSTVPNTPPAVQPTINSASTLTQTDLAGLKSSTVEQSASSIPSSSTTSTARASSTAQPDRNSNGNSGGSGGTPFDITASSHKTAATSSMLAFTLGLIAAFCYV